MDSRQRKEDEFTAGGRYSQSYERSKILIIEDDADIAQLIKLHLQDIYQQVTIASDGLQGFQLATDEQWDLIVLDIRLPGKDGLDVCRALRARENHTPIVILTSKSSELDRVLGLEMGADDYLTKPFSVIELAARVKAILRRLYTAKRSSVSEDFVTLSACNIELDTRLHRVTKNKIEIDLTAKEFSLLYYFLQNPGRVFSRAHLLNKVWGYGHEGYEHTVNSHINRLRSKIEDNPARPKMITTIWGVGYKLNERAN